MWQVDWWSHLWSTESSWDVSHSSTVSDQHSLYQIRPSGSSPRSSIMWSALKLKSYLLLDLLRIRSLSCITTLKDESRTVELCIWCSLSHKRRLWDVQQNGIFHKCLRWMWIFFLFIGQSLPKTWAGRESFWKRMNLMEPVSWAVLHQLFPPPAPSHPWFHCLKFP